MASAVPPSRVDAFWQPGLQLWILRAANGIRGGQIIDKLSSPVSFTNVEFLVNKDVHAKALVRRDAVLFHASCRGDIAGVDHVNFEAWTMVKYNLEAGVFEKADGTTVTSARDAVCATQKGRPGVWVR